jgi:hypothetical protein
MLTCNNVTNKDDLDSSQVAFFVDLPIEQVAWLCQPAGVEHWSTATVLSKNPIVAMWHPTRAPLWNHHIRRPLLFWDEHRGRNEGNDRASRWNRASRGTAGTNPA